jgi:hypothetical protein
MSTQRSLIVEECRLQLDIQIVTLSFLRPSWEKEKTGGVFLTTAAGVGNPVSVAWNDNGGSQMRPQ